MAVYCKPRAIAYFGLMHMVATNLCIWLNVIIEETKHEILHQFTHHTDSSGSSGNLFEKSQMFNMLITELLNNLYTTIVTLFGLGF